MTSSGTEYGTRYGAFVGDAVPQRLDGARPCPRSRVERLHETSEVHDDTMVPAEVIQCRIRQRLPRWRSSAGACRRRGS